jgi:hypothetical protein
MILQVSQCSPTSDGPGVDLARRFPRSASSVVISSWRGSSLPAVSACREEVTTAPTSAPKRCRVRAEPET